MNWKKIGVRTLVVLVALMVVVYVVALGPALKIATGYHAEILGSATLISGREPEDVLSKELSFLSFVSGKVDREAGVADSSVFGLAHSRAIFRPGLGVTLVHGDEAAVRAQPLPEPMVAPENYDQLPWPEGNAPETESLPEETRKALEAAIDVAFEEPKPESLRQTRAVVVVHRGKLLAERYAEGFTRDTPLTGWSMTKSVTNALIGILVREGKMDIHAPAPVPEWKDAGDPRSKLTTDVLLRMSSGLAFSEEYFNPFSDATKMLFASPSAASVAAASPLEHEPDTVWHYSSGTTNLLARIVGEQCGDKTYADFANRELFAPLGMYSAVMSADASGHFVGSSFGWATARDWAKFGQLFLEDGVWKGKRILPEGWVDYSRTPTPPAPEGGYGAQWWLNVGEKDNAEKRPLSKIPNDAYYASGFEGQRVFVVPSHDAVILRLGLSKSGGFPWGEFVRRVLEALPAEQEVVPAPVETPE